MIAAIIQRLDDDVSALKIVAGAAAFMSASEANPPATPAAWVLRLSEIGGSRLAYGRTEQRIDAEVGIVLALKNVADVRGAAAGGDLDILRNAVRAALLGWAPTGCDPLEFASGGVLAFRDGHLWWQDIYRTRFDIVSV